MRIDIKKALEIINKQNQEILYLKDIRTKLMSKIRENEELIDRLKSNHKNTNLDQKRIKNNERIVEGLLINNPFSYMELIPNDKII